MKGEQMFLNELKDYVNSGMSKNDLKTLINQRINQLNNERYLHINKAAALIKSIPTDQAIQKMKAALSGQPETIVIDGELFISIHNDS